MFSLWYGIDFHAHALKTHFNNKGFALGLIFSEGFWILEVAYWVPANVAKWNLAKLNITQYWSVVSPLIHCGSIYRASEFLQSFCWGQIIFLILQFTYNRLSCFAPIPPSLPQDKSWQVSMKLSAEVLKVMAPGGCRSQGCRGYIQHSLKVPLLCSGDLSTPIYWWQHNTNH